MQIIDIIFGADEHLRYGQSFLAEMFCHVEEEKKLLRKTIRLLPAVQFAGADGMDFSYCYPQAEFNSRSILWDLNYFKYCFLKATGMDFQEDRLEDDFQKMADVLLRSSSATFSSVSLCRTLQRYGYSG